MKRIYQWIEKLPEPERSEASNNMTRFPLCDRNELTNSLKSALLKSFIWGRGIGTIEYWAVIYNSL